MSVSPLRSSLEVGSSIAENALTDRFWGLDLKEGDSCILKLRERKIRLRLVTGRPMNSDGVIYRILGAQLMPRSSVAALSRHISTSKRALQAELASASLRACI